MATSRLTIDSMPMTPSGTTNGFFRLTEARFCELLADHADPDHLSERLIAAERRNLGHYWLWRQRVRAVDDRDGHRGDRGPVQPASLPSLSRAGER